MEPLSTNATDLPWAIIEHIDDAVVVLNRYYCTKYANGSFLSMFSISEKDLLNKSLFEIDSINWNTPLKDLVNKCFIEHVNYSGVEFDLPANNTESKRLFVDINNFVSHQSDESFVFLVIKDISKIFLSEKYSMESLNWYIDSLMSTVIIIDHDGTIVHFNKFTKTAFGYEDKDITGKYLIGTIIPLNDSNGTDNSTFVPRIFQNPDTLNTFESECILSDGSRRWFIWNARIITYPDHSNSYLLIDGKDITALKKIQIILEEKSAILDSLLYFIPEGIMITDSENKIRTVSQYMKDLFDMSNDDLLHITDNEFLRNFHFTSPSGEKITKPEEIPLIKAAEDDTVLNNYKLLIKNNGYSKTLSVNAAPIKNRSGKIIGAIGTWHDVTDLHKKMHALEQRERVLDAIMKYTPFGIMLVDRNAKITNASRYLQGFLEIPENKLVGTVEKTDEWGVLDPSSRKPVKFQSMPLYRVIHEQKIIIDEEYMLSKNGIIRYFAITAGPILDDTGKSIGGISVWRDITESRKLLRENEHQKNLLELIISEIPVGIAIHEGPEFTLSLVNATYSKFAYSKGDIKGKKISEVFPEAADKIIPLLKHVYETGKPFHVSDEEFTLFRNNTPVKTWFTFSYLPFFGERDTITGVLTWAIETTSYVLQQREIELSRDQLRSERELLQTILDSIPVMITLYDPQLQKISLNKAFEQITGWTEQDFSKQPAMELIYPDPFYRNVVSEFMRSHRQDFKDIQMRMKNGKFLEVSWANVYLPDGRGVGIGIDITERKKIENELTIAAQRFNRITSSNIVGTIITDFQGQIFYANDYFLNTIGYSREDFENDLVNWRKITPSEYSTLDNKALHELSTMGNANPYEKEFVKKDGTRVWVLLADTLLPGPENYIFAFVLNIDDRVHALDEAQTRRAEIEAILNSIPDGYIVYNKNGSIVRMNKLSQDILGLTENMKRLPYNQRLEKLNPTKPDGTFFSPEQLPSWRALQGEYVKDIVVKLPKIEGDVWISASASPIIINGRISGAIMEFVDISKLHKLQIQLSDERNFVNTVLQTSGALTLVIGKQGQIIRFNKECERLTGYSEEEFSKINILELIPQSELDGVRHVLDQLFDKDAIVEYENHWITKSGEKRFIRWRNSSFMEKGGSVRFVVATGVDISDRKLLEEELKTRAHELTDANTNLQSFSYSVSHDLRSPLGIIDGFTNILIDDYSEFLDIEGREYLRRITGSVKKMQQLIDDMLSLSKVSNQELKRELLDISSMINDYLFDLHSQQPERTIDFHIQKDVSVEADPKLLHVAIENLLRNSWKFTSKKELTYIEFGFFTQNNERVFFIRDNGVGFDMKFSKTIFEPFKRVHPEKAFSGTGVGLSIVQRVITRHGGRIWAESEPDKGATFFFTLG